MKTNLLSPGQAPIKASSQPSKTKTKNFLLQNIYKEFYLEKCTNLPLKPIFPTVASSGSRPSSLVESNFLPAMTRN